MSDLQYKLNELTDEACENIEELLISLDVRYKKQGKLITGRCPVHGGDNPTALNLYHDGYNVRGIWYCRTRHCEQKYKKTLLGLVRGILSHQRGTEVPFMDAVKYVCQFLGYKSIGHIKEPSKEILERRAFTRSVKTINLFPEQRNTGWNRWKVRKKLIIPAEYYRELGYNQELLDTYDIGLDTKTNRIVVPVYDNNYKHVIGFLGRSLYKQCQRCKFYHDPKLTCPITDLEIKQSAKWVNSQGFNSGDALFNYWFAKDTISKTGKIILVESVGNVLRCLQNGITNVVATFGTKLSSKQEFLIHSSGAMYVILLMDNDEAGKLANETMKQQLKRLYHVKIIEFSGYNDIGMMPDDVFCKEIKSKL